MELDTLGTVKLTQILHILDGVRRHALGKADDDIDVTMEFLVGSLFPELYQNFNAKIENEVALSTDVTLLSFHNKKKQKNGGDECITPVYEKFTVKARPFLPAAVPAPSSLSVLWGMRQNRR